MGDSKTGERIILVTGATGRQGGAVYRRLHKKGFKLRALVRDPNSNQARQLPGNGEELIQGSLVTGRRQMAARADCVRTLARSHGHFDTLLVGAKAGMVINKRTVVVAAI
jgi:nucleoside-diphosphate-sugar epimerase